jgi:hypothetical protein
MQCRARGQPRSSMFTQTRVGRRRNSLFPPENSLFREIFSLLIRIGNCPKSHCVAADFCSEIVFRSHGIAHFPVKFPVSREFAWRRVKTALRRQPGSSMLGEFVLPVSSRSRIMRSFGMSAVGCESGLTCNESQVPFMTYELAQMFIQTSNTLQWARGRTRWMRI